MNPFSTKMCLSFCLQFLFKVAFSFFCGIESSALRIFQSHGPLWMIAPLESGSLGTRKIYINWLYHGNLSSPEIIYTKWLLLINLESFHFGFQCKFTALTMKALHWTIWKQNKRRLLKQLLPIFLD